MSETFQIRVPQGQRGKWIALRGGECFAWGDTPEEALSRAEDRESGASANCFVTFVSKEPKELIL